MLLQKNKSEVGQGQTFFIRIAFEIAEEAHRKLFLFFLIIQFNKNLWKQVKS